MTHDEKFMFGMSLVGWVFLVYALAVHYHHPTPPAPMSQAELTACMEARTPEKCR